NTIENCLEIFRVFMFVSPLVKQMKSMDARLRLAEARAILARRDKRLNHLGRAIVAVEAAEFCQPELIAVVVTVRRVGRVSWQVTEVLDEDESRTKLG